MAKTPPPSGRSKIRIFFVDADLAPGDMQELTNALASAIRPTHMITRTAPARLGGGTTALPEEPELEEVELEEAEDDETPAPAPRAAGRPRKYRSPKPVNDLDPRAGGKAFDDFAREKGSPAEHTPRYLVAAYWLAEYAGIPTVTVDHVFTCYKAAGWRFDVKDPGFPFRYLKGEGMGDTKGGKFTINHLGRARVEKMAAGEG